jgi:TolB-like protein
LAAALGELALNWRNGGHHASSAQHDKFHLFKLRSGTRRKIQLVTVAAVLSGLAIMTARRWPRFLSSQPIVAILPLKSYTGGPSYIADGLTEGIITELAKRRVVRLIAASSVLHFQDSTQPARDIANELHASTIVEGSLRAVGGVLELSLRVIDPGSDTMVPMELLTRPTSSDAINSRVVLLRRSNELWSPLRRPFTPMAATPTRTPV